ncbi:glutamate-gated chloride channel-like [Schistocerca americana]|uniref:glutamate-gated chloride channel-like n=1 Tax=Schistocerca americana TaxID=7009 RepID=UPI001F4FC875|nr:glutamate-gated chloride channel-like [Schistocerca americana]
MAALTRWLPGHFHTLVLMAAVLPEACCVWVNRSLQQEMQTLELLLRPDRYDPQVRPPGITGANPTIVRVNLFVRTLTKFDDQNMEFETQITFKEQWTDARLKFNDLGGKLKYLTLTDTKRIWIPDVFFVNEKKAYHHNVVTPNVYIRIFSYGTVLFSTRISMTLSCPMDLRRYPHDVQVCSLMMGSYGWKTDDVVLLWKDGDPVQIMSNLHLSLFTLEKFLTDYCNTATTTGDYSCLKVELLLRREFNYYMIHVYLPSCMLVIMSWASFWLDRGDTASRLSLVVAALLMLAVQVSRVYASVPQVAYTMAIDVWIGGCFTFVFTALLESTLVSHASRSDLLREMKERGQLPRMATDTTLDDTSLTSPKLGPLLESATFASHVASSELLLQKRRQLAADLPSVHSNPAASENQYIAMVETRRSDTAQERTKEQVHQPCAVAALTVEDSSAASSKEAAANQPGASVMSSVGPTKPEKQHGREAVSSKECEIQAAPPAHRSAADLQSDVGSEEAAEPRRPNLNLLSSGSAGSLLQARAANCCCCVFLAKFPSRATRIDIISRITFPIAFTLFNCFYWYTYLFTEEEP